ncbi:hypothetical protein RHGRI_034940 [Rhododendron griersonianum]|uniref:Uncharacterized protein n=1 Tax=Rhododendron griersonianum TaxID=479676 RepID=A0AAV6I2N2_9ERIC|nr:hypothetical protein RHGRI_034940 [Rhododendron griersonianum]
MNSLTLPFLLVHFSLLILLTSVSATSPHKIPRLSVLHGTFTRGPSNTISASASNDMETFFYNQTLDHFNYRLESYATFKQKYVINSKYWGGAKESAPISVYFGDEQPLDDQLGAVGPLDNSGDFKGVLELIYAIAAQYDSPPSYPVSQVCERIDGANEGTDILGRIFAGFVAVAGNMTCYRFKEYYTTSKLDGWTWQVCSELVIPVGIGVNDTMFQPDPFNLKQFINGCRSLVLENLSDTLLAVHTAKGSHCSDILTATKTDPQWLIDQRKVEIKIIEGWFETYYSDLHSLSY